ncbi:MAG: hypothetical protein A2035_06355 [Nitrospirae bacterium GWA2_42_11]|nr:MAG: hypothetical protein A2035_06355 [Nitrospirae bacterium GWA2_42_11]HAS16681.1 hypothetical protein [Nitrospiraceae bacterium]
MGISSIRAILPPKSDQIEVTLIGPGYGETILIHLGNNKWVVVDSCIDSRTSEPAALSYLQSIGINPETSVVLIIATHWHDDHVRGSSVWTLSPSDKQVDLFLSLLTQLMPKVKETKFRVSEPDDNLQSIVTLIEIGNLFILLGGDLMETTNPDTGWSVIVESAERPRGKACIYKVPHHGSKNAHSDDVWNKMLLSQPYAILTPFN